MFRQALTGLCSVLLMYATTGLTMARADTLADTRTRDAVRCGVNSNLPGFSRQNSLGEFSGFDVDFCRAVSAAIFGEPDKVEYFPVSAVDRLVALRAERFDLLSRNTTVTLSRDVEFGEYAGVLFYDGQGFMVRKESGIRTALELDNRKICVTRGTTTELNAADFFKESQLRYRPVYFNDGVEAVTAYEQGACDSFTSDRSALAAQRISFEVPDAHLVLPEVISKEPLGPLVRHGDTVWENIARWTLACLVNAEELRVTQKNVASLANDRSPPPTRRLLGIDGNTGELLNLQPAWCANVIASVGNYQEIYDRHIGPQTAIGLDRGVNALWTNGGLMYAPPFR